MDIWAAMPNFCVPDFYFAAMSSSVSQGPRLAVTDSENGTGNPWVSGAIVNLQGSSQAHRLSRAVLTHEQKVGQQRKEHHQKNSGNAF